MDEERGLGQLEFDRVSARKTTWQKRCLGRQCSPGLRMTDEAAVTISEQWYKGPQTVAFRTRGVFGTQFRKVDALSIKDILSCQMRHSGPNDISKQSRSLHAIMQKTVMTKRQKSCEVRETCAIGSDVSVVQRHAQCRRYEKWSGDGGQWRWWTGCSRLWGQRL